MRHAHGKEHGVGLDFKGVPVRALGDNPFVCDLNDTRAVLNLNADLLEHPRHFVHDERRLRHHVDEPCDLPAGFGKIVGGFHAHIAGADDDDLFADLVTILRPLRRQPTGRFGRVMPGMLFGTRGVRADGDNDGVVAFNIQKLLRGFCVQQYLRFSGLDGLRGLEVQPLQVVPSCRSSPGAPPRR